VIAAVTGLGILAGAVPARAGTIYVNDTDFFNDVSSLTQLFYEDFDGYAVGGIGSPFAIAGGLASVLNATSIVDPPVVIGPDTDPGDLALSQGLVASPVSLSIPGGVDALGFYFLPRNNGTWTFGTDQSGAFASGGNVYFVGWIGAPGESITTAFFSSVGLALDDVYAYQAVPEPATLLLLGAGLAIAGVRRHRRRN
jgi:hypothetical protein